MMITGTHTETAAAATTATATGNAPADQYLSRRQAARAGSPRRRVSVIIPALNEAASLRPS